jgi:hypothetical protein
MRRTPLLVLICGLLTATMGMVLLAVSNRIEGIVWLAAPITLLGLALVVIWLRGRRSAAPTTAAANANQLPGAWYPYAILGVLALLMAWVIVWSKLR